MRVKDFLIKGGSHLWHGCMPLSLKAEELVTSSSNLVLCTHLRDRTGCVGSLSSLVYMWFISRVSIMEWTSEYACGLDQCFVSFFFWMSLKS